MLTFFMLLALMQSTPVPACDVNGDGTFNVADLQAVVNAIMSGNAPPCRACDLNQDKAVNIIDLQDAVNIVTGKVKCKTGLQMEVKDGTPPFVWTVIAGKLPAGMALSTTGLLYGIPTEIGTFSFTIQAMDSAGVPAKKDFTLAVNP